MADKSIDDLLAAIESIQGLKDALLTHDDLFATVGDRLAAMEQRLSALEAAAKPKRGSKP